MKERGATLIELIVSLLLFSLVIAGIFLAFTHGSRTFSQSLLRQGLQGDSMQLNSLISKDVRMTNYLSAQVVSRDFSKSDGSMVRRDGTSVAALSDWEDNALFDGVTGLPLWDRHIVYYVTDDGDQGRLIRQVIDPGAPTGGIPYLDLVTNLRNDPSINNGVISSTTISQDVEHFEVRPDDGTQALNIVLHLRRRGGRIRGGGETRVDETLEVRLSPSARNTFPPL